MDGAVKRLTIIPRMATRVAAVDAVVPVVVAVRTRTGRRRTCAAVERATRACFATAVALSIATHVATLGFYDGRSTDRWCSFATIEINASATMEPWTRANIPVATIPAWCTRRVVVLFVLRLIHVRRLGIFTDR